MVDCSYVLTCEALAQSLGLSKPATPVIQEVEAEGGGSGILKSRLSSATWQVQNQIVAIGGPVSKN